MRLILKWRVWPFSSFLGLLDLKTGVVVALLFALLNKVAGVYGLIALATGAGGSFAQFSLYLYSVIALLALGWGLKAVNQEDARQTLYFAHLFFADHIFSTSWTVFFAVVWWFQNPHDGARQANSRAQEEIIKVANISDQILSPEERARAAMEIWNHEKGTAFTIILLSWLSKIYFALLIYSYATHLRKGSYRSLPHSRQPQPVYDLAGEDEEIEDFYRLPVRGHQIANSISSFTDFVNPASRRQQAGASKAPVDTEHEEVLFDEDELAYSFSSRVHSKMGTDESSTSSTTDDERKLSRSRV